MDSSVFGDKVIRVLLIDQDPAEYALIGQLLSAIGPNAYELIIGTKEDSQFGPAILFGHGGTAVELIKDTALGLPPLNVRLAREMIARTRIYKLLKGFRDRPPVDIDALALTLIKVSQLIVDIGEIKELDINPLVVYEKNAITLDARIIIHMEQRGGS